jgi:hypothetical protein
MSKSAQVCRSDRHEFRTGLTHPAATDVEAPVAGRTSVCSSGTTSICTCAADTEVSLTPSAPGFGTRPGSAVDALDVNAVDQMPQQLT